MDKFAKELGIKKLGKMMGKQFVIELDDSDEYSRAYTTLDKSHMLTIEQDKTVMTGDRSELVYSNDEYTVILIGDMDKNKYQVVIEEN